MPACGGCFSFLKADTNSPSATPTDDPDPTVDDPIAECVEKLRSIVDSPFVLDFRITDGVAVISLGGAEETNLPWGTNPAEHRLYPAAVLALLEALDRAEKNTNVLAVVLTAEGKYWSNGFDLKYIQHKPDHADLLQNSTEVVCARILKFPKPTVAALNGHATAAGAMLMLSFDVKVMNSEKGYWFVPGIDLGLVYSPGMSALMCAKLPFVLQRDVIVFGKRYTASTLLPHGVIDAAVPPDEVLDAAVAQATALKPKAKHQKAMSVIKETLYHEAIASLTCHEDTIVTNHEFRPMGFDVVPKGTDKPGEKGAKTRRQSIDEKAAGARRQSILKAQTFSRNLVPEQKDDAQILSLK